VKEIGEPADYSDRRLSCFYNCADMWCSKKIPNQQKIYDELTNNRLNRHGQSIA